MARKKKPPVKLSAQDRVYTLSSRHTQKELAARLGVSVRTIQRWKNGSQSPTNENARKLSRASSAERKSLQSQARRAGVQENIRSPLPARRQQKRDPENPDKRIPADTVIFDARRSRLSDVVELLAQYRGKNIAFRIIYTLPAGKSDYNMQKYKENRTVSTPWESILQKDFQTDAGLTRFLEDVAEAGKRQYVVITLPKRGRGSKATKK